MAKLNLRFVQAYRDRHGRLRHYFRRHGSRSVPLPGLPGSEEFMAAYQAALGDQPLVVGLDRAVPGTIDALVVSYYSSNDWKKLASEKTRQQRKHYIDRFRQLNGPKRVSLLRQDHLAKMMADLEKDWQRVDWLKAIRGLLEHAKPMLRRDNPADGLRAVRKITEGYHTWTDEQVDQYRAYWPNGTQQRLAFELGLEGLSRRCEIVTLGPQHVKYEPDPDRPGKLRGRIKIARAKGSNEANILMTDELQAAVEAMPKEHLVFFPSQYGKARTAGSLGDVFAQWAAQAGLPRECRLHGLKKAGMNRLAESSATTHEIMGASGHKTLAMVEKYTAKFDRRKAADRAIEKRKANKTV